MKSYDTTGDKAFLVFNYILMTILMIVMLYPFWDMLVLSFSPKSEIFSTGLRLFTLHPELTAYKKVFDSPELWQSFYNSIVRVILGTVISVILTSLTAYPLAKKYFPLNKLITGLFIFTMLFSGGLIPGYLLMKKLNMLNTIWVLVVPGAVSAYNLIIMRNFLRFIPDSMEESARIDGATEFKIWWKIILPLSKPVMATVALWVAVEHWNAYFDALIYITDRTKYVLPILLRRILLENQLKMFINGNFAEQSVKKPTEETVKAAVIMVSTLPIVMVYPFLQKYFMKGIMLGAVKG